MATLDYGKEVAGNPYFIVSALSKPVQIEIRYSEAFDGLNYVWADGPYYYSTSLSSTFRVETFNITAPGRFRSYFIQGGQRWESITLLNGGQISFSEVGVEATVDVVDLDNLPSQFNCSNDLYNSIWKLGAGAASVACVDAGTQLATWDITDQGAYVRGQKPAVSALGSSFANYTYFERTGDVAFAAQVWLAFEAQILYLLSQVDPLTHLVTFSGFLGPSFGCAISAALVQGLNGAAVIADAIGYTSPAAQYRAAAASIATGINTHLWNPTLGIYSLSTTSPSDFSLAGLSFAITSGVADADRATKALAAIPRLALLPGYKDSTTTNSSDPSVNISPNTNGFLLSAAMIANDTAPVKYLLDNLWATMTANNLYSTGASWEYVGQDTTPGLGLFTSLAHPWGGAPTYVLPEYIAGLRPTAPGYKTFVVVPAFRGFNLSHAAASIETPYGRLAASWRVIGCLGDVLTVRVDAPEGTVGSLQLPGGMMISNAVVNGKKGFGGAFVALGSGFSTVVVAL